MKAERHTTAANAGVERTAEFCAGLTLPPGFRALRSRISSPRQFLITSLRCRYHRARNLLQRLSTTVRKAQASNSCDLTVIPCLKPHLQPPAAGQLLHRSHEYATPGKFSATVIHLQRPRGCLSMKQLPFCAAHPDRNPSPPYRYSRSPRSRELSPDRPQSVGFRSIAPWPGSARYRLFMHGATRTAAVDRRGPAARCASSSAKAQGMLDVLNVSPPGGTTGTGSGQPRFRHLPDRDGQSNPAFHEQCGPAPARSAPPAHGQRVVRPDRNRGTPSASDACLPVRLTGAKPAPRCVHQLSRPHFATPCRSQRNRCRPGSGLAGCNLQDPPFADPHHHPLHVPPAQVVAKRLLRCHHRPSSDQQSSSPLQVPRKPATNRHLP